MPTDQELQKLRAEHTAHAIQVRLNAKTRHSYLRDFVYGAIDGAVTTFAVVSGVAGAELSAGVVIILGFANLVGDGFSMAAGNYLASKADLQLLEQARRTEERHIRDYPEGEREEVRQILASKGFTGANLQNAVDTITSDEKLWVDTMLQEELGLSLERPSPLTAATTTFFAFVLVGLLPLIPFLLAYFGLTDAQHEFQWSALLTGAAFFCVGTVKARFVAERWYWSGFETLLIGGTAAALAYAIGVALRGLA